jgi:hypothetical protein
MRATECPLRVTSGGVRVALQASGLPRTADELLQRGSRRLRANSGPMRRSKPHHSISPSAVARSDSAMVMWRAFAVFRLITW